MGEKCPAQLQRRAELYGPERCLGREAAKQMQTKDHIKQNFLKGAETVYSSHTFQTTTAREYRVR